MAPVVTGIGQCSLDYLAVVKRYPEVDTKEKVLEWIEQGGGPVATALVTLRRLGIDCRFFGIIGDDEEGKKIQESLQVEGINIEGLRQRKGASSQVAFIVIEQHTARRTIFWRRPSGRELQPDELSQDFLQGASFLLLDGLMVEVSLYAARKARESGVPVMLDAGRVREGMLELARLCDYVVGSEEFARDLGWQNDPEAFGRIIKKLGFKTVTITLGERGSVTYLQNRLIQTPAFRVQAVDTTGAGDVFHGGYIYGLIRDWPMERILLFASAVAALKCTKIGGRTGIPDLKGVEEFLSKQGIAPFSI